MTLLAPVGLWFLLALLVIFILYLIQSRYRPHVVASVLLWKRMARDLEAEASWRRPRWDLLLALQLLVALLAALALARPALSGGSGQRLVVVLDQSASMAARDVQPSRFAAAQSAVASIVGAAAPDTRITLVSAGTRPRVVVDGGTPANVMGALNDLAPDSDVGDVASALRIAAGLAAPHAGSGSHVVVVTDGAVDLSVPPQAVSVSFRLIGGVGQSLAVSEVSLRRPIDRIDYLAGFTRVVNFSGEPRDTTITIVADSIPVDRAPLRVPASGHAEATFHVPVGVQSVSVGLSERTPLASSERVNVQGYGSWARRATIVSDAPASWERVLSVVPDVTTRSIRPQEATASDVSADEILLFDNIAPPIGLSSFALILVNPPDPSPFLQRIDSLPRQRRAERFDGDADPLLRGLDIAPLSVQQVQRAATPAWAAVSVEAEDTPLILHGRIGDQRAVIFTFDPNKSNLPRLAAFPQLMSNAIDWLVPGRSAVLHAGLGTATSIQPRAMADLSASSGLATVAVPSLSEVWPWLVAAAGLLFVLEWAVAVRRG